MRAAVALALAAVVALGSTAWAGDKEKADVLFKQGRKLLGEKRYADACQAFEDSFKLDPEIGAELNIALCYQEWGKLARAYRAYAKAEDMAKEQHDSRADKIEGRKNELDAQVPRLTIKAPSNVDTTGLEVSVDGKAIKLDELGQPIMVDPGPHMIEWGRTGAKKKNKVVPLERGGSSEVAIDVPEIPKLPDGVHDEEHHAPPPIETPPPAADPGKMYRYGAYGAWGTGGLLVAISSYLTLSARSKYNDALSAHCMNTTNMCDSTGLKATHDARHEANIATGLFIAGVAVAGGGVALWFLAPKAAHGEHAMYLTPTVSSDGAGIVFGGRL